MWGGALQGKNRQDLASGEVRQSRVSIPDSYPSSAIDWRVFPWHPVTHSPPVPSLINTVALTSTSPRGGGQ